MSTESTAITAVTTAVTAVTTAITAVTTARTESNGYIVVMAT